MLYLGEPCHLRSRFNERPRKNAPLWTRGISKPYIVGTAHNATTRKRVQDQKAIMKLLGIISAKPVRSHPNVTRTKNMSCGLYEYGKKEHSNHNCVDCSAPNWIVGYGCSRRKCFIGKTCEWEPKQRTLEGMIK